jgi:hypothetical protein
VGLDGMGHNGECVEQVRKMEDLKKQNSLTRLEGFL